jgi:AcrR family transcriptional regulator
MGDIADAAVDAALRCIARWGVAKTTLEDVAREARTSRATVYRAFPGGKDALFAALADRELGRLEHAVATAIVGAGDLEDALVAAIGSVARHLDAHTAFQYLLVHEPGFVLPHLAFHQLDALLARVRAFGAPLLAPHLGGDLDEAGLAAEWVARIVLSYTSCPAPGVRLTDDLSVRQLVRSFVLPGLLTPA